MNRLLIFFFTFLTSYVKGQNDELNIANEKFTLYLTVKNSAGNVLPKTDFNLTEKSSGKVMNSMTDEKGKAEIQAQRGKTYILGFKENPRHSEINIPASGNGFLTKTITYDTPQKNAASTSTDTIKQNIPKTASATATESLVKIGVTDTNEKPLANLGVGMFCRKTGKYYSSKTDNTGEARFLVLINNEYEIDVDSEKNYRQIIIPDKPYIGMTKKFSYRPTLMNETVSGDTIRQQLGATAEATNARVLINMLITDLDKRPLAGEPVYLNELGGTKIYHGITDTKGNVSLLVPKGAKYLLSFKYERDIDLLDLMKKEGYRTIEIEYAYMGSEKIEAFYKNAKRDAKGFLTEFMEVKVTPTVFQGTIEKTAQGFNINYEQSSSVSTPAAYKGILLTHSGYYTRDFFSFHESSGKFNWGIEFAESGPSSVVVEDDVILVNTQSCTLYALEVSTGKLLWSKWLGPDLYSTPSVSNGKVYAVYPNELGARVYNLTHAGKDAIKELKNVLACFDLQTGKIVWQNWVNAEALSSPVVSGNNVYITCLSGKLYEFDKNKGELLGSISEFAVTPPTVVNDKVFVSIKNKEEAGHENVAVYSANGLKLLRKFNMLNAPLVINDFYKLSASEQMNFCGSRVLHFKGKNYNVMGDKIFCTNPEDGTIIWSAELPDKPEDAKPAATMPIAAGEKIIITTRSGKIIAYDAVAGKQLSRWDTGYKTQTQAVINNGWIYSGTEEGKTISINTGDANLSGWNMFGYDGSHNTVVR